ncbi:MAG: hypothetical protein KN64_01775 [Sulfurovum sp. AS07-7]|nr:MAG: hypothetical protein KN64_01775 [Sulfurovum sp. AS07-7]
MSKELQQLNSLLEYVKKIGELHQKIIFKIEDYKKVFIYEYNARICQDNLTFNFISTKHLFHYATFLTYLR